MRIIITSNVKALSLMTIGRADVVIEHDTSDFYYVYKNMINGYKGSLHKKILVEFLRGDFG